MVLKKKKSEIKRLKTMVKEKGSKKRAPSVKNLDYKGFDFYEEHIYRLDNNIIRNID